MKAPIYSFEIFHFEFSKTSLFPFKSIAEQF